MNMATDPTKPLTRITVMQGQARVSAGPRVEFSTVLGSCVATCLYDPEVELGGMNHFLLAEPLPGAPSTGFDERYGVYPMELLINKMLANGASKPRLACPSLWWGQHARRGGADRHDERRFRMPVPSPRKDRPGS